MTILYVDLDILLVCVKFQEKIYVEFIIIHLLSTFTFIVSVSSVKWEKGGRAKVLISELYI